MKTVPHTNCFIGDGQDLEPVSRRTCLTLCLKTVIEVFYDHLKFELITES